MNLSFMGPKIMRGSLFVYLYTVIFIVPGMKNELH